MTAMGWQNVCWGSDYPHLEGTFGHTQKTLHELFDDVDEADACGGSPSARSTSCSRTSRRRPRSMSLDRFSLDGKVAIVTGGAGGCGEEYGRGLTTVGVQVVLADLDGERAEQNAKELREQGRDAIGVRVDITDPDAAAAMVAAAHGRVRRRRHPHQQRGVDEGDPHGLGPRPAARVVGAGDARQRDGRARVRVGRGAVDARARGGRIINQVSGGAFIPGGVTA